MKKPEKKQSVTLEEMKLQVQVEILIISTDKVPRRPKTHLFRTSGLDTFPLQMLTQHLELCDD